MLTLIIQGLISGILLGGVYALLSAGLSLYFGVARVANSAHAAFAIFAAHIALFLYGLAGVDPILSIPIIMLILFIIGAVQQKVLVNQVIQQHPLTRLTLTFFVAIVVENAMILFWQNIYRSIITPYAIGSIVLYGISFPLIRVVAFILSMATLVFLMLILKYTKIGKAIRATAENGEAAQICGVNISLIYTLTAGIAFSLGGLGGVLLGLLFTFYPAAHVFWIGKMYTIVILGGIASIEGSFVAAFIIGFLEAFVGIYLSIMWASVISWMMVLLMLSFRRGGLLGK
ncbi:MAG: branched-chain amino acid ABC transporter permease [Candidatus Bathyarchaeia archaeon]